MDEPEGSLEWFVHQMCEVVLYLLRPLDIRKLHGKIGQEIYLIAVYFFRFF